MSNPMAQAAALTPAVTEIRDQYHVIEQANLPDADRSTATQAERAAVRAIARRARRYAERLEATQADLLDAIRKTSRPTETGAPE